MAEFLVALTNVNVAVGAVSLLMVFSGLTIMRKMPPDSPLNPYVLQVLGLLLILPVVLLVSLVTKLSPEAITGLLGTIVGYIFGSSTPIQAHGQPVTRNVSEVQQPDANSTRDQSESPTTAAPTRTPVE